MNYIKQVVMLHYTIPPVVGGVEFMIEPLSKLFVKNGWHVSLITGKGNINKPNIKSTVIPELFPGHPKIIRMQENLKTGSFPDNYELEVTNFEKNLMTQIGDIRNVIIHNIMTMSFNLVATSALHHYMENNPEKNFYVWIHDMAWLMKDHNKYLYKNKPWSILKTTSKNVKYITISKFRKKQAMELFNIPSNRIQVVPNGIEVNDFLYLNDSTKKIISKINMDQMSNMILIPARILPRKNLLRSLDIIAELIKVDPTIVAVLSGSPDATNSLSSIHFEELKNHAQKLCLDKNNLIFLHDFAIEYNFDDKENREIVRDFFNFCKAVMLLSTDEGFGIPLLEAGISKKSLILSDLEVFHEIADKNAIFIPEFEPTTEAAKRINQQIFQCSNNATAMFRKVIKNYSWDAIWDNYLNKIFSD